MAPLTMRPTRLDQQTAGFVADHTTTAIEQVAGTLTWAADEHVLAALALGWWVYCRNKGAIPRRQSDHILLTTVSAAILPHIIKRVVDQERPDRLIIEGHMHGVPFSGRNTMHFRQAMLCTLERSRRPLRCCPPCSAIGCGWVSPSWWQRAWCYLRIG